MTTCGAPTKAGTPCKVPNCAITSHVAWHAAQVPAPVVEETPAKADRPDGSMPCRNCEQGYHWSVDEIKVCFGVQTKVQRDTSYADYLEQAHFHSGKRSRFQRARV